MITTTINHRFILALFAAVFLSVKSEAQEIIPPANDSTFVSEFRDGRPWAVIAKNGFIVGLGNKVVKDDYGKYYQLTIMIQNISGSDYTFIPDSIHSSLTNKRGEVVPLKVYSNEEFQKKIKRDQFWSSAFTGLSMGLNSSQSSMPMYIQLDVMDKQMELDRKIREEGYLKKNTIHYGEGIIGFMNVKRIKGKTMQVVIPVNGIDYIFDWNVEKLKKK